MSFPAAELASSEGDATTCRVNQFKKLGYAVVKRAVAPETARLVGNALLIAEFDGALTPDSGVPGTSVVPLYSTCEALLLQLLPQVEAATGLELCPTYSCARIYREGNSLPKHRDRAACEISASMTLSFDSPYPYPLFLEADGEKAVDLGSGDMLIYRGCDLTHWREPLRGALWIQAFFHYIDKSGPYYPEHRYDRFYFKEMCYEYIVKNLMPVAS